MNICVHTSFNRRGVEEPRVFFVGGHRLIVAAVLQCWVDEPNSFYEVSCDDGRRFLLRHDGVRQTWELAGVYAARVRAPKWQAADGTATPAVQPKRWWSALLRA